ncbi:MAG: ABC transporter permease [Chloroflexi bacterium]|nr:ABC transporter permease [Chloroflexota bacterium]
MLIYLLRRLGFLGLTVVVTSLLVFLIAQVLPGDVCRVILGREAGEARIAECRADLHLDDPAPVRYLRWLADFARGDWGESYATGFEIRPLVLDRLRMSLMLAGLTFVVAVPLAVALGMLAAVNRGKWLDTVISLGSLAVVGLPEFVTGILLIELVAFRVPWLPASSSLPVGAPFRAALPALVLPALTATLVLLAYIARLTRAGVVEELKQNYVRTAELKGLPRLTVLVKHVLRNALLPTITVVAISAGWLVSGLVVIENVFNYPGLGRLLVFAIDRRDLPALQAIVMLTVVAFALANLAADLLYAALNPRIRVG